MGDDRPPDDDVPGEPSIGDGPDPFEGLTLDEDFIAGASVREESAEERLARLACIEAEHRRLAREREVQRAALERSLARKQRRLLHAGHEQRRRLLVIVAMILVFGSLLVWNVRRDERLQAGGVFGDASAGSVSSSARPPAGVDSADEPLGAPPPLARESSAYAFIATQEGSDAPVAYDPCRPIHVVENGRTAFMGSRELVQEALDAVSAATGLIFAYDGPTDEEPSRERAPYQPERYGERWAPVLIAWSDPARNPELQGTVAGLAGSSWVTVDRGSVYVTGSIELDGPQLAEIVLGFDGVADARSVIEHELGHLVGLDHVDDPTQLMNPTGGAVTTYAEGDLTGLWHLGQGECFPQV